LKSKPQNAASRAVTKRIDVNKALVKLKTFRAGSYCIVIAGERMRAFVMFAGEPVPDAAYVNVFVPGVYVKIVKVPLKIPVPPVTPSIIIVAPGRRS
jgi:hypothetical protein